MLEQKRILITGSSRGIGKATAQLARQLGARIVIHGKEDSESLQSLAQGLEVEYVTFDATDQNSTNRGVEKAIERLGGIDGLINCVGAPAVKGFLEASDEDWLDAYKNNFLSVVHICKAVIPSMQKGKSGKIVNVASVRGHDMGAGTYNAPYSAAKAGIKNLTVSLAKEFGPGINVNSVSPGFTETDFSKTWNEKVWEMTKTALVGRVGQPSEIAGMLCFLVSDQASFITAQDFVVDGGILASTLK